MNEDTYKILEYFTENKGFFLWKERTFKTTTFTKLSDNKSIKLKDGNAVRDYVLYLLRNNYIEYVSYNGIKDPRKNKNSEHIEPNRNLKITTTGIIKHDEFKRDKSKNVINIILTGTAAFYTISSFVYMVTH